MPRFAWILVALLFASNAAIVAVTLLLDHPESYDESMLWVGIAGTYLATPLCALAARRVSDGWALQVALFLLTVAITWSAYWSGEPNTMLALPYVWVVIFAFYFFSRPLAIMHLGFVAVGYALVVTEVEPMAPVASWITLVAAAAVSGAMVNAVADRERSVGKRSAAFARGREDLLAVVAEAAKRDRLTGLLNRAAWEEGCEDELARAVDTRLPFCVAMLDIDRFKLYNDTRGHQAGDWLLAKVGADWQGEVRSTDVLARYGGEEFCLLMREIDTGEALPLVERVRTCMPAGQSASAGLAAWDGQESLKELVGRADAALYDAKAAGRDQTVVAAGSPASFSA